jgi:high-affinity nickel-transport protein
MSLMDTTDGILMSKAYNWALLNPLRKIFYNLATTGLSVAVALAIGSIELLQVLINVLDLRGRAFDAIVALDFGELGYVIVGLFVLCWGVSVAMWKFGRIEERTPGQPVGHGRAHCHDALAFAGHDHAR